MIGSFPHQLSDERSEARSYPMDVSHDNRLRMQELLFIVRYLSSWILKIKNCTLLVKLDSENSEES